MKLNKVAMAVALTAVLGSMSALAADTTGVIQLEGELVNTACGLAPSSSPVMVDFAQVPVSQLMKANGQVSVTKNIELQSCDTIVAKTATVTYTPTTINPNNAALAAFTSGTATGAGIALKDSASQDVVWGDATASINLVDGKNNIPFVAVLKAENSAAPAVTAGAFQSTINFTIAYL